jgi:indole-3-glycerol phosphate synthase
MIAKTKPLSADTVLGKIVASKIAEVEARARLHPLDDVRRGASRSDRPFLNALWEAKPRPALIAEVKKRSPSKGVLRTEIDVAAIAEIYGRHAAAISVVTDGPFFGGELAMIAEARRTAPQPVMLKDFVVSEYQVYEARSFGADALLLMASVLEMYAIESLLDVARALGMEALVEVHTESELDQVLEQTSAQIIGVNNRDLRTLAIDTDTFIGLAPRVVRQGKLVVAESGMTTRLDVDRVRGWAGAVLIGSTFMEAADLEAKIVELGW